MYKKNIKVNIYGIAECSRNEKDPNSASFSDKTKEIAQQNVIFDFLSNQLKDKKQSRAKLVEEFLDVSLSVLYALHIKP